MLGVTLVLVATARDFDVGGGDSEGRGDESFQFIVGDFAAAESDFDGLGGGQIASAESGRVSGSVQEGGSGFGEVAETRLPIPSGREGLLTGDDGSHQGKITLVEELTKSEPRGLSSASDVGGDGSADQFGIVSSESHLVSHLTSADFEVKLVSGSASLSEADSETVFGISGRWGDLADPGNVSRAISSEDIFASRPGELVVNSAWFGIPRNAIGQESVFAVLVDDGPVGGLVDDRRKIDGASNSVSLEAEVARANSVVAFSVDAAAGIARSSNALEVRADLTGGARAEIVDVATVRPLSADVISGLLSGLAVGNALSVVARLSAGAKSAGDIRAAAVSDESANASGARVGIRLALAIVVDASLVLTSAESAVDGNAAVVGGQTAKERIGSAVFGGGGGIARADSDASVAIASETSRALWAVVSASVRGVGDSIASSGAQSRRSHGRAGRGRRSWWRSRRSVGGIRLFSHVISSGHVSADDGGLPLRAAGNSTADVDTIVPDDLSIMAAN